LCLGRCAFGINADMQNNINNPYLRKSVAHFEIDSDKLLPIRLTNLMPFLARPLYNVVFGSMNVRQTLIKIFPILNKYIEELPIVWLSNNVQKIVDLRTKSLSTNSVKPIDLLQLMIDVSTSEKVIVRIFLNIHQIPLR
jgi:hypothetical protein